MLAKVILYRILKLEKILHTHVEALWDIDVQFLFWLLSMICATVESVIKNTFEIPKMYDYNAETRECL